jgi:hypothetical protein
VNFTYISDRAGEPELSKLDLFNLLQPGDALTWMGVPPGEGARFGGDRDADGILDADEAVPALTISHEAGFIRLQWPRDSGDWFPETSSSLQAPWRAVTEPRIASFLHLRPEAPPGDRAFYRLRRTW